MIRKHWFDWKQNLKKILKKRKIGKKSYLKKIKKEQKIKNSSCKKIDLKLLIG